MGRGNEVNESGSQDKLKMPEAGKKQNADAAQTWNEQATRRPERQISPEEKAERQRIEARPGAIGRGFDQVPTEQNVRDWYNKLSPTDKEALKNPQTSVTLTCTTSHTGEEAHNKDLSVKSGEAAKNIMQKTLGIKASIHIEGVGFDPNAPEKDNRFDRQVYVDFKAQRGEQQVTDQPKPTDQSKATDGKTIKDLTEPPAKPKAYDFEKEVRDRIKDITDIRKGNIEKAILNEIGKLAKTYFEGVHEMKTANVRAAEITGIKYALQATTQDWFLGRSDHIQQGKPYTAQELKKSLSPADKQYMDSDMRLPKMGATDKDLDRGFQKAADAANQVLRTANTPQERQVALKAFSETILPRVARNCAQRYEELRRGK